MKLTTQVCNTTSKCNTIDRMKKCKLDGFRTKVRMSLMLKLRHRCWVNSWRRGWRKSHRNTQHWKNLSMNLNKLQKIISS